MSDEAKSARPPLPRDAFRAQRTLAVAPVPIEPVVVTPAYDDAAGKALDGPPSPQRRVQPPADHEATGFPGPAPQHAPGAVRRSKPSQRAAPRNPFEAYGERSSSRPYALRLPDAIDLVIRQMAAEERTHPLRIVDRILHDHLKRIGRLPPHQGA